MLQKPVKNVIVIVKILKIFRHLEEDSKVLSPEDISNMTPEELDFHYFSAHDYDRNSKLDGLEMLKVIRFRITS